MNIYCKVIIKVKEEESCRAKLIYLLQVFVISLQVSVQDKIPTQVNFVMLDTRPPYSILFVNS